MVFYVHKVDVIDIFGKTKNRRLVICNVKYIFGTFLIFFKNKMR